MVELSSAQRARREKILAAGQLVILRSGFRAATMEAIATHAGVAKPTLYKYFPDKASLYDVLVVRMIDGMRTAFDSGLMQAGSTSVRIAAALVAKKKFVFHLLQSSPHAEELGGDEMQSHLEAVRAFEQYAEDEICGVLVPNMGDGARYMAQILIACANGIGKQVKYSEQIGPAIRLVVGKLLD